jgi:ATP-binding protein involved in chromosome partitioning
VAVNLAVAAARRGLRVGLLDADIFGPSMPTMLGTVGVKPTLNMAKKMLPPVAHGIVSMSIGYLVDPDKAVVWRGPMVMSALLQLLSDTDWGDLDILFIDTPPGTGEVQLTLAQRLPLDGAVIVSTPQEVALADVRRGVALFEKTSVPILGLIENMAWFEERDGARAYIFGRGGAERCAGEMNVPFLGALPLMPALREAGEEIALPAPSVQVIGCLGDYPTRTGFIITPVVGALAAPQCVAPDRSFHHCRCFVHVRVRSAAEGRRAES